MPPDVRGIDPADLRGIENGLRDISSKLDKPFAEMNESQRHAETIHWQKISIIWQRRYVIATTLLVIFTLITVSLNVVSWNKNKELVNKQLELIELQKKTLTPILPQLLVEPLNELKFLDSSLVRNGYDKDGHWVFLPQRIPLRMQNLGLSKTGAINIVSYFHPWISVGGIHIDNLNGLDKTIDGLRIYHKNCYESSKEKCDESVVPSGYHNLTLEINCLFCESKIQYQNLTICIWKNSSKECE